MLDFVVVHNGSKLHTRGRSLLSMIGSFDVDIKLFHAVEVKVTKYYSCAVQASSQIALRPREYSLMFLEWHLTKLSSHLSGSFCTEKSQDYCSFCSYYLPA